MRGKVPPDCGMMDMVRITPAYAGKSNVTPLRAIPFQDHPRLCGEKVHCFAVPRVDMEDHPRLCGEKSTLDRIRRSKLGSPPPMRGKVLPICILFFHERITPAYAGKSARWLQGQSLL